jgi:hypothetical protein
MDDRFFQLVGITDKGELQTIGNPEYALDRIEATYNAIRGTNGKYTIEGEGKGKGKTKDETIVFRSLYVLDSRRPKKRTKVG